jgi:Domain of unknown function (DUF4864)
MILWKLATRPDGGTMVKTIVRGLAWLALVSMNLGAIGADPPGISEATTHAVQAVVKAQLDALATDNAALAFSFAAPAIREQIGNAPAFMAMVREGYPMLISPRATSFFLPRAGDGAVVQVVQVRDQGGRSWLATYVLQQQPDQSWRIAGCAVAADEGGNWTALPPIGMPA